jgi:hypothetical protein
MAIKTSMIVRRLQQNFSGELDTPLTPSQLKSAELLLNRTLPVLSAMEVTQGNLQPETGPLETKKQLEASLLDVAATADEDLKRQLQERIGPMPALIDANGGTDGA